MRRWPLLIPLSTLPAWAAPGDAVAPDPAPVEVELELEVWGPPALIAEARALAVFFDGEGHRCVADRAGLHCVDDHGEEVWGVDLPGVEDVRLGRDVIAVDTTLGWTLLDRDGGASIDPGPYADFDVAFDARGGLVRFDDRQVVLPDGQTRPVPEGLDLWDVVVTSDGRVAALDGGLTWLDAEGPSEWLDLELGLDGFMVPLALDDGGLAVLDDEGLVLLDRDGTIRAEVDLDGDSLIAAEGELWVGTPDGVIAVDPTTGAVDDELVMDGEIMSMDADGDAVITLDRDGRIQAWDGERRIGGVGHAAPVIAIAPDDSGGAVTVDADGEVIRWRAGVPERVAVASARDAAFDGRGTLWIATDRELVGLPGKGPAVRLERRVRHLLGLPDGVLAGDGSELVRLDAAGEAQWTTSLLHDRRPSLAEGVILSWTSDALAVIDLQTGIRRRLLPVSDGSLRAAGVAVGGLVVVGTLPEIARGSSLAGWRPGSDPGTPYSVARGGVPAMSPDGRWVALAGGRAPLVLRSLEGWPVLGRGPRDGRTTDLLAHPSALVPTASHVWIGRDDGRLERWSTAGPTDDTDLPGFVAYAQLDAFVAAPDGPAPTAQLDLEAPLTGLAAHPDGSVAVGLPAVAWVGSDGGRTVPALDPPLSAGALLWDPRHGLIAGGTDGRIVALDRAGLPTALGRAPGAVTGLCSTEQAVVAGGRFGLWIRPDSGEARVVSAPGPVDDAATVHVACGPDGTLAWEAGAQVRVYGPEGWSPVQRAHPGGSRSVVFLADGSVATGGNDETVVIWDPARGQALYVLEGHEGAVVDLAVDVDGTRMLAGGARGALVWDLARLAPTARLAPDLDVVQVVLAPDGQTAWLGARQGPVRTFSLPQVPEAPEDSLSPAP